jgi:hypothetical protein
MAYVHILTYFLHSLLESDIDFGPFSAGTFLTHHVSSVGGAIFDVEHQEIKKIGKFHGSFHFSHIILILSNYVA